MSAFEEQIGGCLEADFNGPATRDTVETLVRELADGALPDTTKTIFGADPYYGMARIAACFENKPTVEATVEALASLTSAGKEADQAWAHKTLEGLNKVSPTSLKVTLAQIQRGRSLNLKQCLELEYRIAQVIIDTAPFTPTCPVQSPFPNPQSAIRNPQISESRINDD